MHPVSTQAELVVVDEAMDDDLADEVGGGGVARVAQYIVEEVVEDEEEEQELRLDCHERRSKAWNDTSSLAAPVRIMDIQGLTMSVVECSVKEVIPEALLCELPEINAIDVGIVRSEEGSSVGLSAGPEVILSVPHEVVALVSHTILSIQL